MVIKTKFKVAEVQISYQPTYKIADRPRITASKHAYDILIGQWNMSRIEFLEEFKILLVNRRNRVLGVLDISQGGLSGTIADPKVIFAAALKSSASGIILCHNHPSGEVDPSEDDKRITAKLKAGGRILDLNILDHLIISKDGYYSFGDEGIL